MSVTTQINAVHVLFLAEPQIALDQAAGTYDANLAANSRHYMWQGTQQLIPTGMDGDPEGFARGLRIALPQVNTLRLSFNDFAFDENGALHPLYERFIAAAVQQGFKLIFAYTDGGLQELGRSGMTEDQLYAALDGEAHDRMMRSWDKMMDWLDTHAGIKSQVWGYELANEPAAYQNAVVMAPRGMKEAAEARFVDLFARHMAEAARFVDARAEGKILIPGWGYSARFEELAEHAVGTRSALQYLRAAAGEDLVWAAHLYPGWHTGPDITDPAALIRAYEDAFSVLGSDDILLTETNLAGALINDFSHPTSEVTAFARTLEWFATRGIGVTWFSAAEAGASNLVVIDPGTNLRLLHQHSYAFALNAFSLGGEAAAHAGDETVWARTFTARLRNEAYEADWKAGQYFDIPRLVGTAFGQGGNDRLIGNAGANNFLYGGSGQDRLTGAGYEDFLFGQWGDDALAGGGNRDLLFGGTGNDLLRGGAGDDTLEGGAGMDRFDAAQGSDLITDLKTGQGDRVYLGRGYDSWTDIAARLRFDAVNGAAVDDVVIRHADGSRTVILDARATFGAASVEFTGRAGWVQGTSASERIAAGFEDFSGMRFEGQARRIEGLGGNDTIESGLRSDTLSGDSGDDRLVAGGGATHLLGGAGRDLLIGGAGNNRMDGGSGADRLNGSGGTDRLYGGAGNDRLYGQNGDDRLNGGTGRDLLSGGAGRDTLDGGGDHDRLLGGEGGDRLSGGNGNDLLQAGSGRDRLSGGAGNDRLLAGPGADTLMGDGGQDRLVSALDRTMMAGGAGRDTLVADLSRAGHVLTGGADRDTFVFKGFGTRSDTRSVIEDFNQMQDRLIIGGRTIDLDDLPRGMTGQNGRDGFVLTFGTGDKILFDDFWL
ncbi:calcium-binding protein [Aliigemmobacter aestuarii]|uniref:Calcium-binding protein n=1 Tax=Aliigemmobacter aestuarii TaxID=1445661 RepID=A0A4S3MLL5_9RHOB|nr:calcium-binding protein [Gemmobacter aestuarii]THD83114.1 calcium-binding protein [Gemmobacter aestuarii]